MDEIKISECTHQNHGRIWGSGEIRDMQGNLIQAWSDPSIQCSGCGMPLEPINGWVTPCIRMKKPIRVKTRLKINTKNRGKDEKTC